MKAPADDRTVPSEGEVERALRRSWFPVARVQDLTEPRRVVLLGEELVVYMTASGRPAVASGHCPHRGGALSLGWVQGEAIVCPYHGWVWRASDGRCTSVPSMGPVPGVEFPSKAILPTHRAEERFGLVWCCLEEPAMGIPSPPELDDRWRYGWVEPVAVACGIRNATENFRDVAHFPFVHRGTMGEMPHVVEPLKVRREGIEVWMDRTYVAAGGTAGMYATGEGAITFSYHAIPPALVFIDLDYGAPGHRMVTQVVSPHSLTSCTIFLGAGIGPGYTLGTVGDAVETEGRVLAEDVPILNTMWPAEAPLDGAGQSHVAADHYTLEFRRAFSAFVRLANDGTEDAGAGPEAG